MKRRQFLGLTALGLTGSVLAVDELFNLAQPKVAQLYSASDNNLGEHFLTRFDLASQQLQQQRTAMRGHAVLALDQQT
ncbi:MAG TPA: hypothetical protein PLM98_06025, partial [Thiolinea sp.]|nr:hypothetical protein [Thiolinea sp.]